MEEAPVRRSIAERLFWVTGWVYDFSKIAIILLLVGLLVHYFFFSVLVVRGRSMEPNYRDGDVLVINKIAYITGDPKRGDIIAMFFPGETEKRFIKRIIGLPGETVKVVGGQVYIDDQPLAEPYLPSDVVTIPDLQRQLEQGEYFAFGDNRPVSSDSRAWGPVPKSFIIGKIAAHLVTISSSQTVSAN